MKVHIDTTSAEKKAEIAAVLKKYCLFSSDIESADYIVWEQSSLTNDKGQSPAPGDHCVNRSLVYIRNRKTGVVASYEATIPGLYVSGPATWGWENNFIPAGSVLTLQQSKNMYGTKVSARQEALDLMLQDNFAASIAAKNFNYLAFAGKAPDSAIDLSVDIGGIIDNNTIFARSNWICRRLITAALNEGLFLRAPQNRALGVLWAPGLNTGVPVTPKRDVVHEATYLMHDLMHQLMPDAMPSGNTMLDKMVYVASRMLSEVISMILADVVFTSSLQDQGLLYDFSKRKIMPAFEKTTLRGAIAANVEFALLGDISKIRETAASEEAAEEFQRKYLPFFISDYRWTLRNYKESQKRKGFSKYVEWLQSHPWSDVKPPTTRDLIDEFKFDENSSYEHICRTLERFYVSNIENHFMRENELLSYEKRCEKATKRWLLGQAFSTFYYQAADDKGFFRSLLMESYHSPEAAKAASRCWFSHLQKLGMVTQNQATMGAELFPVFPATYVSYDQPYETYPQIEAWVKENL